MTDEIKLSNLADKEERQSRTIDLDLGLTPENLPHLMHTFTIDFSAGVNSMRVHCTECDTTTEVMLNHADGCSGKA